MTIAYAADGFFPVRASYEFTCVSFPPSPSPLRLFARFAEPGRPIISDRRHLARVSLQSRIVGASEVTSEQSIGKGLGPAEYVAWELLTPFHRFLIVALVAITSAESRRSHIILQLQRSVDIKDEVLKNMQMKLNDLLNQMGFKEDHTPTSGFNSPFKNEQIIISEVAEEDESIFHGGTRASHFKPDDATFPPCHDQSIKAKDVCMAEPSKENYEMVTEQEERRMSDLSDFCWSVASSIDSQPAQLSTLAAEQELYNLRKECEEKDAAVKELATAAHASNVSYSKRITELEEVIRRKSMIITKLKKDMSVLEQQIVKLTRLRRPSYASSSSRSTANRLPLMTENVLYDMSCTSSSSSDCDSPQKGGVNPSCNYNIIGKAMGSSVPTAQKAMSRKVEASVSRRQFTTSNPDQKKSRRGSFQEESMTIARRKWI